MIRLRQVALVARSLDAVVDELHAAFGLSVAYQDPGVAAFGLVNAVLPVGDEFLEVVSPVREGTAAGRQLDRMGGDGGYMVICHTDDQAPFRERAASLGIRSVLDADHDGYRIWQLHPGDTGGSFLEIDVQPRWDSAARPWMPAGPDWRDHVRTEVVGGIEGVELAVPDVQVVSARWRALLGGGAFDNAALGWRSGDRGLVAVDLRATDRGRVGEVRSIGGVELRLV